MENQQLSAILNLIENAEKSLQSAKELLNTLSGGSLPISESSTPNLQEAASNMTANGNIIEGIFDGQNMLGPDGKNYPVPSNYASKSKLIPGDGLKLTITSTGSFLYKQIAPIPRKNLTGTLVYQDGQYKVMAEGRAYNVLLASITYFRASVGDTIAIIVPEHGETNWAAVENVLPQTT